jgi:hypothetical protein
MMTLIQEVDHWPKSGMKPSTTSSWASAVDVATIQDGFLDHALSQLLFFFSVTSDVHRCSTIHTDTDRNARLVRLDGVSIIVSQKSECNCILFSLEYLSGAWLNRQSAQSHKACLSSYTVLCTSFQNIPGLICRHPFTHSQS